MAWKPISSDELWNEINAACARMDAHQERLWETIRITPQKWALHPWGDKGEGFWVVGVIGEQVLWYNDIEDGFNISPYKSFGAIDGYFCNQDELEWTVQQLLNQIQYGYGLSKCSPPIPSEYPPRA